MFESLKRLIIAWPVASTVFLAYAIAGGVMLLASTLEYGGYADNLMLIGIGCGAIGIPRAIQKAAAGVADHPAAHVINVTPVASATFVIFVAVSSVALVLGKIEFGAFSENTLKVGIGCGAIAIPRVAQQVTRRV